MALASTSCLAEDDPELVAQSSASLSGLTTQANLTPGSTPPGNNRRDPTAAWIRTPNDSGGGQTLGNALVGFTNTETLGVGDRAAWSVSAGWTVSSPIWFTFRSNDSSSSVRWPPPDNLCEIFPSAGECVGGGTGWNSGTTPKGKFNSVASTLYTGLNNVGAFVGTSGYDVNHEDVYIAVTIDGGLSVEHTQLLTVADAAGLDTGIDVDPDSVFASTAAFGEVTTPRNGEVALPIYVVWRQRAVGNNNWWWTRVLVGVSGTVAEVMKPRKLSFLPTFASTHVNIFGYRKQGVEHIGLAWSSRSSPSTNVTCPSASTFTMTWLARESADLGDSWGCFQGNYEPEPPLYLPFEGCASGTTTIVTDSAWKPCLGPIGGGRQASANPRPEVAMNMPALPSEPSREDEEKKFWTFVVSKSTANGHRVCSYRTGGDDDSFPNPSFMWDNLYDLPCSSGTDPGGVPVADAWGQSIAIMNSSAQNSLTTILLKESTTQSPQGIRMVAMELDGDLDTTFTEARVTTDVSTATNVVPFGFETDPGFRTGVATYQQCDIGVTGCPGASGFLYPALGVFGAWPDTRVVATSRTDAFARSWLW